MPAELLMMIVAFASPSCQVLSSLRMAAILDGQMLCVMATIWPWPWPRSRSTGSLRPQPRSEWK